MMLQGADKQLIERRGRVVGYHPQGIVVEVAASLGCVQCAKGQGCGAGLLARRSAWQLAVDLPSDREGASLPAVGSEVTLVMPRSFVTRLTWLIYGLPLLMALVTAAVGRMSAVTWLAPSLFFGVLAVSMLGLKYALGQRAEQFRPHLADAA
ncbi:SoxR reducing system RseC family protein [Halomonas sp. CUBES01]|uniref:SoxR reducing system RseC family protein n=1 Tax=Halomonas sp. CUBES01 TaxID=2897340 RepID=UPI001E5B5D1C|nr:SoxR reducing system RseC family protein [Halomonas sp. CUBES01]MEC4767088.1 SoxR reducing system RseC family protein [Halomonas sp. CUBES01]